MKNRRQVIQATLAVGALSVAGTKVAKSENNVPASPAEDAANQESPANQRDRKAITAAGLTEAEADCWQATADAAAKFFALPELHPMDQQEVASAIHILQNKLLSRPTYRTYLAEAKRLIQQAPSQ